MEFLSEVYFFSDCGQYRHGGTSASAPWDVFLWINETLICGGFLVTETVLVTASSCLTTRFPSEIEVRTADGELISVSLL